MRPEQRPHRAEDLLHRVEPDAADEMNFHCALRAARDVAPFTAFGSTMYATISLRSPPPCGEGYRIWDWKNSPAVVRPLGPGSSLANARSSGTRDLVSRASGAKRNETRDPAQKVRSALLDRATSSAQMDCVPLWGGVVRLNNQPCRAHYPASLPQLPQPRVCGYPQADRRRKPDADRQRLLEDRMSRVERRDQEHADEQRDGEVVQEGRGQLHLLIVNEVRHANPPRPVGRSRSLAAVELDARPLGTSSERPRRSVSRTDYLRRRYYDSAQRLPYSSWRRHQMPVSLRPLGARSSH